MTPKYLGVSAFAKHVGLTERIDPTGKIRPQLLVTPAGQSYFAGILTQ